MVKPGFYQSNLRLFQRKSVVRPRLQRLGFKAYKPNRQILAVEVDDALAGGMTSRGVFAAETTVLKSELFSKFRHFVHALFYIFFFEHTHVLTTIW